MMQVQDVSLYIHIPFCCSRCSYCDFITYSGMEGYLPDYIKALCLEAEFISKSADGKIDIKTIYFGGGTPSLVPVTLMQNIMEVINSNFSLRGSCEISLEANPGTVRAADLIALREIGFNRLSLGMQSALRGELKFLGRIHEFSDVEQSVNWARKAGFDNINLDLIYGIPNQSLSDWQKSLTRAMKLDPDHISLYALTIEEGTPLHQLVNLGRVPPPDDDLAADMYEWAGDYLESNGRRQYEISNWARSNSTGKSYQCEHNLQYWHNLPYLGLGCGAHGFIGGYRLANKILIPDYIHAILDGTSCDFPFSPATARADQISRAMEMEETMMLGLRLVEEGVSSMDFSGRFGASVMEVFNDPIHALLQKDLIDWAGEKGERLRLTRRGRVLGNQVFMEFVGGVAKI